MTIPERVETDLGEAVIKVVSSSYATKIHKCPYCNTDTEFYEEHYLILPLGSSGYRRYFHSNCLRLALDHPPLRLT